MSKKHNRGARRLNRKRRTEQLEKREMLAADIFGAIEALDELPVIEVASYDGTGNNLENDEWGAADTELLRLSTVDYADGLSEPSGEYLPSSREVSNAVVEQDELVDNDRNLTDFVWLWGQFIDHDITLSVESEPTEHFDIEVPLGDADFDPFATGEVTLSFDRSEYEVDDDGVYQQINAITAYIDGSVVYGSDEETTNSLRSFEDGKLLTSEGDLLPIGEDGFFLAGDIRANENVALTSMHTLWVREHNQIAESIAEADPTLTDEEIFQQARSLVVAEIQAITYNEWLPALLGVDAISDYSGYDSEVNASIANAFSTAAYRFGHSMLSTELLRLNEDGTVAEEGNISLSDAFFSPDEVLENGIDSLLLGASTQVAQEIDTMIAEDVRSFLFGPPGAGGLDLAALNIQRGRDHGLPDYNQLREDYGLEPVTSFSEITSDAELASKLEALYGSVDDIDPWVGILAEDHVAGSSLGELGRTIIVDQFERIRSGDRLWYENQYSGELLETLQETSLSDIVVRNTEIESIQDNVFYDESVLYYKVDSTSLAENNLTDRDRSNHSQQSTNEMMLIAQAGELRLIDTASGDLLSSIDSATASKVVIVGSDGNDRVLVHPSALAIGLAGGIVIDGDSSGNDQVVLMGGSEHNTVSIDGAFAEFDSTTIQFEGIDALAVETGQGRDNVEVIERGDYRLSIDQETQQAKRMEEDKDRDKIDNQDRNRDDDHLIPPLEMLGNGPQLADQQIGREVRNSLDKGPNTRRRG